MSLFRCESELERRLLGGEFPLGSRQNKYLRIRDGVCSIRQSVDGPEIRVYPICLGDTADRGSTIPRCHSHEFIRTRNVIGERVPNGSAHRPCPSAAWATS